MVGLETLKKHPAIADVGFAVGGNVIAAGLSGLAMIIFGRTLGPETFGIISVGFSLMLIAARVAEGGLVAVLLKYLPTASTPQEERKLFWATLQCKILLGTVLAVVTTVIAPQLAHALHVPTALILVVGWLNLVTLLFDHLGGLAMALLKIRYAVVANFVQASLKLILAGVTFFNPLSAVAVLAAYMIAPIPATWLYRRFLPQYIWQRPPSLPWTRLFDQVRSMATHNWLASISSAVVQNVDVLIVSFFLPGLEVGYVGAASRIAMFVSIVGSSLSGVLNPRVAKLQTHTQLKQYWGKSFIVLLLCGIGAVILPLVTTSLIQLTTGPEYQPASHILAWMLAATCFSIGLTPFAALFFRYHQPSFFSVSAVVQAAIMCIGGYFAVQSFGMVAVGWVRMASQTAMLLLTIIWALRAHYREFQTLPWK